MAVPVKGKWAQGIQPRNFAWILKDRLAVCERPGGYGANHRRVRRQEEIIWIREQGFTCVVTLIPSPHNLHNYDELGVPWRHVPFGPHEEPITVLQTLFPELADMLSAPGGKVLVHQDELSDRVAGLMAGYLLWSEVVPLAPQATSVVERLLSRQMGPLGRDLVALAATVPKQRVAAGDVIELRGLRLAGVVGVLPHEQAQAQPLEVDLDLHLDLAPAGRSDALGDTADYGAVCDVAERVIEGTSYALLEALAEHLATAVLEADTRIDEVTVSVRKLRPPVAQQLTTSGVRITRGR